MKNLLTAALLTIGLASCQTEPSTHTYCSMMGQDMREYQLNIDSETGYTLYKGTELIGTAKTAADLDSLIMADNL